jgi:sarcosine oxidase subunit beta
VIVERGRVRGVHTRRGPIACRVVVLAAGAWALELYRNAGGRERPWRTLRRHLLLTEPLPEVDAEAPYVWDLERSFYARAAEGGLLCCVCDATSVAPGPCPPDPGILEEFQRTMGECLVLPRPPAVRRLWAGLRTFSDPGFLLGPDPQIGGLHWVAALGGHGVTVAAAVGRYLADGLVAAAGGAF